MDDEYFADIDGEPHVELRGVYAFTFRHLETAFADVDLAPCIESGHSEIWGTPRTQKLTWLMPSLIQSALLNGHLTAKAVNDALPIWPIPAWAWTAQSRLRGVLLIDKLTISPLFPAFTSYDGSRVFVPKALFDRWLADLRPAPCVTEPELPEPVDLSTRPAPTTFALPADKPWIGLTEASTWIAFRFSIGFDQLVDMETAEEIPLLTHRQFSSAAEGLSALLAAAGGMSPKLQLAGEPFPNYDYADRPADVVDIDPKALIRYSKPDWQRDGLTFNPNARRPRGVRDNYLSSGLSEGYRYVMVDRAQLLACFPPPIDDLPVDEALMRTGEPGRPTKGKQVYSAEHVRRCQSGEAFRKLADEARHLTTWFKEQYPLADQPSAKSVENTIREVHRAYAAAKAPKIIEPG